MSELIRLNDNLIVHANEIKSAIKKENTIFVTLWEYPKQVHGIVEDVEFIWTVLCKLSNN